MKKYIIGFTKIENCRLPRAGCRGCRPRRRHPPTHPGGDSGGGYRVLVVGVAKEINVRKYNYST